MKFGRLEFNRERFAFTRPAPKRVGGSYTATPGRKFTTEEALAYVGATPRERALFHQWHKSQ